MEIMTKAYGAVKINPDDIITFDGGLIGFENMKQFVLLGNTEVEEILLWLQSIDDENLAFVVIQPRIFKPDYQPKIQAKELEELNIGEQSDLLIYSIVVVPEEAQKMTANLRAPIIVNVKNNKAKQIILNDETYQIKESIFASK